MPFITLLSNLKIHFSLKFGALALRGKALPDLPYKKGCFYSVLRKMLGNLGIYPKANVPLETFLKKHVSCIWCWYRESSVSKCLKKQLFEKREAGKYRDLGKDIEGRVLSKAMK